MNWFEEIFRAPAPIYGQFVRRVLLVNMEEREAVVPHNKLPLDVLRENKRKRWARQRERRREQRIAYMREYNKRIRELTNEEMDRVRCG